MENIKDIIKIPQVKKTNIQKWQGLALEAIQKLEDGQEYKGSIFRCFKINAQKAKFAMIDCEELNKLYALYFLKVFSAIKK